MIEGLQNSAEVVFMVKILLVVLLSFPWPATVCCGETAKTGEPLIPVKPAYEDASPTVRPAGQAAEAASAEPTPRDQMYVFWLLGRMISYPVDRIEAYIVDRFNRKQKEGAPIPATASAPNPFESVNWREIPPAPPAGSTPATKKGTQR